MHADTLRSHLSHVYWIGGPPDAGKSTVAALTAERVSGIHYQQDAHEMRHIREADPVRHPLHVALRRQLASLDEAAFFDEQWVHRSVEKMVASSRANWSERIDLVCADLLALPLDQPVIAEGPGFFPDVVSPLLQHPRQAIWLIPTPAFKERSHAQRGKSGFARLTSNPELARKNHIARDLQFASDYAAEVTSLGLSWISVDGARTVEDITDEIMTVFGLSPKPSMETGR